MWIVFGVEFSKAHKVFVWKSSLKRCTRMIYFACRKAYGEWHPRVHLLEVTTVKWCLCKKLELHYLVWRLWEDIFAGEQNFALKGLQYLHFSTTTAFSTHQIIAICHAYLDFTPQVSVWMSWQFTPCAQMTATFLDSSAENECLRQPSEVGRWWE